MQSAAPVTQNHRSKPEDLMLQNATHLTKSAPWALTSYITCLMELSPVLSLPREMHLCRSSSAVPRLPSILQKPSRLAHFLQVQDPLRLPRRMALEHPEARALAAF